MTNISRSLVLGCSLLALAACGPEDLGSPGTNGDINVGDITVNPAPTATPTPAGTVVPAASCPNLGTADGLVNSGTTPAAVGSYRVCTLPSTFTASATLPYVAGVVYEMSGRVNVGRDDGPTADATDGITGNPVTLSIEPGVIVYGKSGVSGGSYLVVNRGSKLNAVGTATRPIIFTGQADVSGSVTDTTSALWGGIVLLGRAPMADCAAGGVNPADRTTCFMRVEGIADNVPVFGGNTANDNSGTLKYMQIRYSGFTLELGAELQSLTLGGVGSGTTLEYIQTFNSSDDGFEVFGGTPRAKYLVSVGAEDDSFDVDSGAQFDLQFAVAVQRDGVGDRVLESDSPPDEKGPGTTPLNALPRTLSRISNFVFWGTSTGNAIGVRGTSDLYLANGVIYKPTTGQFCLNDNGNSDGGRRSDIRFYSLLLDCTTNAATAAAIAAGNTTANVFTTNTLSGKYLNGTKETNFNPVYTGFTPGFFAATTYIGGVPVPSGTDLAWTRGWTCDSPTVSFNSGISCKGLPVYN
ncbi:hypothetical protein [Alteraurantiacibacter buctensis]|uniref:Lipoprotein n=1 Tax=Alteraurantiacibacter buctensis TaxID=1503981 RepID=A0A844YSL3_9SPHN|nr:hypothetical protein [Alteraurantiacibacter buctensis]MXO70072.1 hypothetical protein [Alteraurantiacibacter buctensis]